MDDRPTSTPPEAKITTARGLFIAHITEVVTVVGLMALRGIDQLSETNFMVLVGGALLGPGIAKVRGKLVVPTAVMLLATVSPGAAKAFGVATLTLLLSGCGGALQQVGQQALPMLLEAAVPHLLQLAEDKGVTLDQNGAVCIEMPLESAEDMLPDDWSIPVVAIMCVAPELPQ